MSDPMSRALPPSKEALAKLEEKKSELAEFALLAAQALADLGYPRSTTVLVDRRQGGDKPDYQLDTGWDMGYYEPSTVEYPHLRRLYLLVDGTLALDAIGKRKRHRGEFTAWVKDHDSDRPELVPYAVSEILGLKDCYEIHMDICSQIIMNRAITPELRQRWPSR